MSHPSSSVPQNFPPARGFPWLEAALVTLLAAMACACMPLYAGVWAFSWDALNHHVYLGLVAEQSRWHLDVRAANSQTYQYPYLYWPVYRLSMLEIDGAWAGALWSAALAALIVPPVWLASWHLLPRQGSHAQALFERVMAVALALCSIVVLAALNTTANDPLAAVPLLWAVALMCASQPTATRAALAAALLGVAIAFKLSHVLALPLLAVWWWQARSTAKPLRLVATLGGSCALGYAAAYAPWGWQLWRHMGNPFHPVLPSLFGAG